MLTWLFVAFLTPALAAPEQHGGAEHAAPAEHGAPAEAGAEHGGGEHESGGGGGHHVTFTGDTDHDGVPNWRDSTNGSEPATADKDGYVLWSLGWHFFNFALLIGGLGYALRGPVIDTFRERALVVRHELTDSARSRDEAHQRHQELLARLDKIENEVKQMDAEAEADAQREEAKLVDRAEKEAARIGEQAERNIRDETQRARTELRQEAVELAVRLAEATLRKGVTVADQQALAREFLQSVKGGSRV